MPLRTHGNSGRGERLVPAEPILAKIRDNRWAEISGEQLKSLLRQLQRDARENSAPDPELDGPKRGYRHAPEIADVWARLTKAVVRAGRGRPGKIGSRVAVVIWRPDGQRVVTRAEAKRRLELSIIELVESVRRLNPENLVDSLALRIRERFPPMSKARSRVAALAALQDFPEAQPVPDVRKLSPRENEARRLRKLRQRVSLQRKRLPKPARVAESIRGAERSIDLEFAARTRKKRRRSAKP